MQWHACCSDSDSNSYFCLCRRFSFIPSPRLPPLLVCIASFVPRPSFRHYISLSIHLIHLIILSNFLCMGSLPGPGGQVSSWTPSPRSLLRGSAPGRQSGGPGVVWYYCGLLAGKVYVMQRIFEMNWSKFWWDFSQPVSGLCFTRGCTVV